MDLALKRRVRLGSWISYFIISMKTLKLTDKEWEEGSNWMREHKCNQQPSNLPTLGEHFYWKIIPNGLGNLVEVGCIYCGECKNVTDINSW